MSAITHDDLNEGTEFYQQTNGRNCKMKVTEGPFEVMTMIAGTRRTQWRWDAIEIDGPELADGQVRKASKYIVTDGNDELIPDIFDSITDLPEIKEHVDNSITINPNDYDNMEDMVAAINSQIKQSSEQACMTHTTQLV